MAPNELQQLLQALDERGISLSRGDVASAFESRETKEYAIKWVQKYTSPDTLLTREERVFYESNVDQTSWQRAGGGLHIPDEDMESALDALEASSASIERQCRLLEAQKHAIEGIVRRNASVGEDRQIGKSTECARDRAQVEFEQSETTRSLRGLLETSSKQADSSISNFPASIDRLVERDDRLLDGLEKVLAQLSKSSGAVDGVQEVHRLCEAFAVQLSEDVHLRMDDAYHQAARSYETGQHEPHENATGASPESKQREDGIRTELEGLCQEIDGLSNMAVDSQYRNPISRALRTAKSGEDSGRALWTGYVTAILQYMTTRMKVTHDHFQHTHSHKNALAVLSTTFDGVLSSGVEAKQVSQRSPTKQSQKGLKPLRLVQANLSESQDPVAQLLRTLDLRNQDPSDAVRFAETLDAACTEQRKNSVSLSAQSERAITDLVAQSLSRAGMNAQALRRAVYAPSESGEPRLLRRDAQEAIDRLENNTEEVGDQMRALNVGEISGLLEEKQRFLLTSLRE